MAVMVSVCSVEARQSAERHRKTFQEERLSSGGDFNGHGFADLLVGAPGYSLGDGIGYILFGKASGFQAAQNLGELDGTDGIRFTADNRDNIS